MTKGNLIIFIDSYPFNVLERTTYLRAFPVRRKMTPGFGYSINLQAEIFTGRCPDELGYFCEWGYAPAGSPFASWKEPFMLLRPLRNFYYLDRIAHRLLGKFAGNIGNIPFPYLPYMRKVRADVFQKAFHLPTLFTAFPGIKLLSFYDFKHLPAGQQDYGIFKAALSAISQHNNIVATFVDLDGLAHSCGIDSSLYLERLDMLDTWINTLSEKFLGAYPNGTITILSDHGIAPVRQGFDPAIEKIFGRPSEKKFFYFIDASILRIWSFDPAVTAEMRAYLQEFTSGKLLSDEERKGYGLMNPSHGTFIFQLEEGLLFNPSFWGKGLCYAMHGYHPENDRQQGIFLMRNEKSNDALPELSAKGIRTTEAYPVLHELVSQTYM